MYIWLIALAIMIAILSASIFMLAPRDEDEDELNDK